MALDTNSCGRDAKIGGESGLKQFQVQPKWEMSVDETRNPMKKIYLVLFIFPVMHDVSFSQQAALMLNEINPTITGSYDLIELIAINGGSVNGFTIEQAITPPVLLATLPQVFVAVGDIIVVHLTPATAPGAAPGSETITKNQYAGSANYSGAWDFHGGATGLTYSNRVIVARDSVGVIQDAVAFTTNAGSPAGFPVDVQSVQALNQWLPSNCGSMPCGYSTTPTVETIAVNWAGMSQTNSAQRLNNSDTNTKADWSAPQVSTWGLLNSGQSQLSGVSGDYNGNLVVDAADYVVWRKAQSNGATSLPHRSGTISGPVGPADYDFWRSRFGGMLGSGTAIGTSTVPEPAIWLLGAVAWGACACVRCPSHWGRLS